MPRTPSFETDRLRVADWSNSLVSPETRQALVDQLRPILTDSVLAHVPPSLQLPDSDAAAHGWLDDRDAESLVLTVLTKDADLLGLMLLYRSPAPDAAPAVHLGYLLSEASWGRGYATELIAGLVSWYRAAGEPVQLVGGVGTQNPGSARVLTKNGFAQDPALSGSGTGIYSLRIPRG